MTLPVWHPPVRIIPSPKREGEASTAPIHSAVGRALSEWEHAESALVKLFQMLCETKSLAACRAYGTIGGAKGRADAIDAAAAYFFHNRNAADLKEVETLTKAFAKASTYRNHIAHGIAVQPHAHGYFLCPPSYASRRFGILSPSKRWGLEASYFYKVSDIEKCADRFTAIRDEAMRLAMSLNGKYKVLRPGEFHP